MGDKHVLRGMLSVANPQNIKSGLNYDEIEKKMLSDGVIERAPKDPTVAFKSEINAIAKSLNLNFETPKKSAKRNSPGLPGLTPRPPRKEEYSSSSSSSDSSDDDRSPRRDTRGGSPRSPPRREHGESRSSPRNSPRDSPRDDERHSTSRVSPRGETRASPKDSPKTAYRSPGLRRGGDARGGDNAHGGISPRNLIVSPRQNTEFERRTREEERHAQIQDFIRRDGGNPDDHISLLDKEKMEDRKADLLEKIDSLWSTLEEEVDLKRITRPGPSTPLPEIEMIYKTLLMKMNRIRYSGLADDMILMGVSFIEDLFDGKRVFFGRYQPDMTDWNKQVQIKLRRMRHDTGTIASEVAEAAGMSTGMRIALELVPNGIMHARKRKQQFGKPTIYSEPDIADNIKNIRDMETS